MKLSVVEPFSGMVAAPNALVMAGGATTVTVAFEVLPAPASVEVAWTLLFFAPAVVPVTVSETVQDAPLASVPAERLAEVAPAAAVAEPPQVLAKPFGEATTKPSGRLSVKAMPVRGMALETGLVMVKVSEVEPFSGTLVRPKIFAIVGGDATERFAEAVLPVPPFVELTAPVVFV